jgi:hypothetical protein
MFRAISGKVLSVLIVSACFTIVGCAGDSAQMSARSSTSPALAKTAPVSNQTNPGAGNDSDYRYAGN